MKSPLTIYSVFLAVMIALITWGLLNTLPDDEDYGLTIKSFESEVYPSLRADRGDLIIYQMANLVEEMGEVIVNIDELDASIMDGTSTLSDAEINQEIEKALHKMELLKEEFEKLQKEFNLFQALESNELMSA